MQELISFLNQNQGWVGLIFASGLGVFLYWRAKIPGIIAFQSHNVSMIGGDNSVFPAEVAVQYRGTPIPRLTSSTVWIWNAGKKIVEGEDIVERDPLRLCFDGEVLNVRVIKATRKVIDIKPDKSEDTSEDGRRTVYCGFGFLEPGDGGVLEVLHTGSPEAPKSKGTIKKIPKGMAQHFPFAAPYMRPLATPYRSARGCSWFIAIVMSIFGLNLLRLMFVSVGDPTISSVAYWIIVPVALFLFIEAVVAIWRLRRQPPSSLRIGAS